MPQRKIIIPDPIDFVDPENGQLIAGARLDFATFVSKLWGNPLWNESWKHGMAQQSILSALKAAIAANETSFFIAGEDWDYLVTAAKTPRTIVNGQVVNGLGYMPNVAGQLVAMQLAIINAEAV